MSGMVRALLLERSEDGALRCAIQHLDDAALPAGNVVVDVHFSSLNYKDGLSISGTARIARSFPIVPGIDLAGVVRESSDARFAAGDAVILTGYGIGERHWGGYTERTRVSADWLVPLPAPLTLHQAMVIGTAGFTAMLAVMALERAGVTPRGGDVLVSGGGGGVGGVAIALLARRGYRVVAASGRPELGEYLRELGASAVIERSVLSAPGKPLESERWAGAIDTVGGDTLAGIIRGLAYGGAVAACGNAGGATLATTVFPFILRGVQLIGIDSVQCPAEPRRAAWRRLADDLDAAQLGRLAHEIGLAEVPAYASEIVAGRIRGRVVVDVRR
jgi:acrylyl-CoA reductase (NADPH)